MISQMTGLAAANFRRAVQSEDRSALIGSARVLIGHTAALGTQWMGVARQLIKWGEIELSLQAMELWGQQGATAEEADYERAVLLAKVGRTDEASSLLNAIDPDIPSPFANAYLRGSIAVNANDLDDAECYFRRTLKHRPDAGRAWIALAQIDRVTVSDEAAMERLAKMSDQLEMTDAAALENALGILKHKRKEHSAAFRHFERSTELQAKSFRYRPDDNLGAASIVLQWTREWLKKFPAPAEPALRSPIFVTGLPRSGTTLVEQILSAHSAVDNGAELGLALQLEATVGGFAPEDLQQFCAGDGSLEELRDLYLRLVSERLPGAGMFVDKSLNQSRSLGPFSIIFPDAPVIWMRRDPLDNAWSIYRSWLSNNVVGGWSLADIAHHMQIEDRLLKHWQEQLGDRLLVLNYADLIDEPERWIQRLTRHCGLTLEPLQLTPHLADRTVSTASAQQVREPINRKGLGVAEPYRKWLAPFVEAYRAKTAAPIAAAFGRPETASLAMASPRKSTENFDLLPPRELLNRFKQAMAERDRQSINRLIDIMVRRPVPLGNQWRAIAQVAHHNGEFSLMRAVIDQWERDVGPSPDLLCEKARMQAQSGDPAGAWQTVQRIDVSKVDALAINFLKGTLSTSLGKIDDAADYLRQAVRIAPASGQSWMGLAMTGRMTPEDGARLEQAGQIVSQAPLGERATYHFALGRWKEKRKDFPAAFAAFNKAGSLMLGERKYDPTVDQRFFENALGYDRDVIAKFSAQITPRDASRPLFVTGLPRSGTTLVEQILAAHSKVDGGGELGLMSMVEHDIGGTGVADLGAYLARGGRLDALRTLHDHLLQERFPGNGLVVDKTLNLSRTLGVLASLYPESKVVWLRRDPADCAWSSFRTYFLKSVDWAWKLEHIAHHFNLEEQLFRHWTDELGDRILVVPYADLVDDPACWTERITRHFGLEPEAAQLESHKVERTVTTASAAQVREPINRKGIGVAEPYRELMKPFFDIYKGEML